VVGTRSPYGAPRNPFDPRYIPGGSSSGSAVAVAAGLVSFARGTDTAGSGRVPAAFNNIVGLKPTRGLLSTRGVFNVDIKRIKTKRTLLDGVCPEVGQAILARCTLAAPAQIRTRPTKASAPTSGV
jgi:hypothetical protein